LKMFWSLAPMLEFFCMFFSFRKRYTKFTQCLNYKSFTIYTVLHGFKWIYTILHLTHPKLKYLHSYECEWKKFTLAQNVDKVQFFIYTYMEGSSTTIYMPKTNQLH
jgi:hypothetical protein